MKEIEKARMYFKKELAETNMVLEGLKERAFKFEISDKHFKESSKSFREDKTAYETVLKCLSLCEELLKSRGLKEV